MAQGSYGCDDASSRFRCQVYSCPSEANYKSIISQLEASVEESNRSIETINKEFKTVSDAIAQLVPNSPKRVEVENQARALRNTLADLRIQRSRNLRRIEILNTLPDLDNQIKEERKFT